MNFENEIFLGCFYEMTEVAVCSFLLFAIGSICIAIAYNAL